MLLRSVEVGVILYFCTGSPFQDHITCYGRQPDDAWIRVNSETKRGERGVHVNRRLAVSVSSSDATSPCLYHYSAVQLDQQTPP